MMYGCRKGSFGDMSVGGVTKTRANNIYCRECKGSGLGQG